MSKALSLDLRTRVLAAVADGASHEEAATRFGVSAASVSRWRDLVRTQCDAQPGPLGGDRRSGRIEAQAALILKAFPERSVYSCRASCATVFRVEQLRLVERRVDGECCP